MKILFEKFNIKRNVSRDCTSALKKKKKKEEEEYSCCCMFLNISSSENEKVYLWSYEDETPWNSTLEIWFSSLLHRQMHLYACLSRIV